MINNDNHNSNIRVDSSINIPNSNTGSTPLAHVLLQLKKNSSDYQHIKEAISNLEKMTSIHGCNIQTDEIRMESENSSSDIFVFSALNGIESTETCNCKKSQCLKLYCQCFAAKFTCTSSCRCVSCENTSFDSDIRQRAVQFMLERNPNAFDSKYKVPTSINNSSLLQVNMSSSLNNIMNSSSNLAAAHKVGCKCRKSKCLKKYCECYEGAVPCSAMCICVSCENPVNMENHNNPPSQDDSSKSVIRVSNNPRGLDDKNINNPYSNNSIVRFSSEELSNAVVSSSSSSSNLFTTSLKRPPLVPTSMNNISGNNAPLKLARKRLKEDVKPSLTSTPSNHTHIASTPSSLSVASALALLSNSIAYEQQHNPNSLATPNSLQIANALAFLSQSIIQETSPLVSNNLPTPNTLSIASALALLSNSLEQNNNLAMHNSSSPFTMPQNKENMLPNS